MQTEEEAKGLIILSCDTNSKGEYVARELVREQTLENLRKFSDRLQENWDWMHRDRTR